MIGRRLSFAIIFFFPSLSTGQPGMFGREEFEQLAPVVDGFSLMTYDYSSGARWASHTLKSIDSL